MVNNKKTIAFIFLMLSIQINFAQTDTLIKYNVKQRNIFTYPPTIIDTSILFENTQWNYGSQGGFDFLDLDPPDSSYNNSGFTDFIPAQNIFSVINYPIRTAVKLFVADNDSLKQLCTGILVESNYVLTSCHCIGQFDTNRTLIFLDSIWAFPDFDNGVENPIFGKSLGIEYMTFKSNLQGFYTKDIALIKLKKDLGAKTGWVGIAFSKEDNYYEGRVFHEFNYPGTVDPNDTTRVFNGDTLYYNYGTLDLIQDRWLGYYISAIPGQSGSSLIYTNNVEYYSFGTLAWANNSRHLRITPEIFYSFKSVINKGVLYVEDDKDFNISYYLSEPYPNPFNPTTKINYVIPNDSFVQLVVYDVLGRVIRTLVNEIQTRGKYEMTFTANGLSSGVYFYRMQSGDFSSTKKLILLR